MADSGGASRPISRRSPEVIVPVVGLAVGAGLLLSNFVDDIRTTGSPGGSIIDAILALVLLGIAAMVWRRGRAGYVASLVIGFLFLILLGLAYSIPDALTGFADLYHFLFFVIAMPALAMIIVYSILGLRSVWTKGASPRPGRMIPVTATLALLTAGFVIGGVVFGSLANGAVLAIGKSSNAKADITIACCSNAGVTQPFSPGNFTMKAGSTVTWVNRDTVTHTVTSTSVPSGANQFDSGSLPYGNTYSVILTVPGTYHYYCSIHPSMTGIIVVTS